jgi:cysteine desulfurase / selenocysteine lyase
MSATNANGLTLEEIEEELQACESPTERLEYLVELGATLSDFPAHQCTEENRVLGCQSMVWLTWKQEASRLLLNATSDAPMVRGLIAILLAAYSGKSPAEILQFNIDEFFQKIQLRSFITPMRSNGLHSMVLKVRSIAEQQVATEHSVKSMKLGPILPSRPRAWRSIEQTRPDFPILARKFASNLPLVYLDNAASSQRPTSVIQAMSKVYEVHYSNVHRSGHALAAETTQAMEASRTVVARFINAPTPSQVIFTSGTTAAINLVARSWGDANVHANDEILLTEMEHHSNIVPWQQLAQRAGAKIRWVPLTSDYQLDLKVLKEMLSPRVKILAITAVSNVLGTINPIDKISAMASRHGTIIFVDAAQVAPHGEIDVQALGADFLAFSGHKMLGPTGIGILYGRQNLLDKMPPFLGGGNMIHAVTHDGFVPASVPHRFEAGTAPIVEAIAMKPAVEYLESLGSEAMLHHDRELLELAQSRFEKQPRIRIYGPPIDKKMSILSFTIDGLHSDEVGKRLDAEGIAIRVGHHCAMPLHELLKIKSSCRASFYFYNTHQEVERFCQVIERLL